MKIKFAQTIRNYDRKNLGKDLTAGLIIMAVSIPISILFVIMQKFYVESVTGGSTKG